MVVAKSAGSFLGGILNNPGAIILGGIAIALLFFQGDIRKAFGDFGKNFGKIELPEFPKIELPDITFPDITFPEFPQFPDFGSIFDIFGGNGDGEPKPVGELPFPEDVEDTGLLTPEQREDCKCGTNIVQDIQGDVSETCIPCPAEEKEQFVQMTCPCGSTFDVVLGGEITQTCKKCEGLTPAQQFALESGKGTLASLGLEEILPPGISPVDVATAIVPFTQEQFQEQAAAFVAENPLLTGSTSLPGSQLILGQQIVKEQEDFQSFIDIEQQQAEQIFQKLFGDVQNPDFPITLGEFIGGETGTVVSPSLFGASESEIEAFFAKQG